jgi:DNA anti-recombination protein RmuC
MADHLLIGILIGMASGIVALIVISALTLRRFDVARRVDAARVHRALADLQRIGERAERSLLHDLAVTRQELEAATRDARDESADGARALRDEITGGLKGVNDSFVRGLEELARLQKGQTDALTQRLGQLTDSAVGTLRDHPMPALSQLAETQARELGVLAAELRSLADVIDGRLDATRSALDERLRQIGAEHREGLEHARAAAVGHAKDLRNEMLESLKAQLEQVRTTVDEKLERTVERRIDESFTLVGERLQLVSERLEQVHRGLGEVQTFAASLGNIQRALTNVRLGTTKTRGAADPAAEDADSKGRAARRKPKPLPAAGGDGGETSQRSAS